MGIITAEFPCKHLRYSLISFRSTFIDFGLNGEVVPGVEQMESDIIQASEAENPKVPNGARRRHQPRNNFLRQVLLNL
jgi:hypothetical protein